MLFQSSHSDLTNSWMCEVSAGFHSDTKATTGYRTGDLHHKTPFLVAAVLLKLSPNALPQNMVGSSPVADEIPTFTSKEGFCISPLETLYKGKLIK